MSDTVAVAYITIGFMDFLAYLSKHRGNVVVHDAVGVVCCENFSIHRVVEDKADACLWLVSVVYPVYQFINTRQVEMERCCFERCVLVFVTVAFGSYPGGHFF